MAAALPGAMAAVLPGAMAAALPGRDRGPPRPGAGVLPGRGRGSSPAGGGGHGLGRPGGLISDFSTASLESPHRFRTLAYDPSLITWSMAAA